MTNFTLVDLAGVSLATVLFTGVLVFPGYVLGWVMNLLSFRTHSTQTQLLLSLPFSVALTPILIYLLGRISLAWPIWLFYGATAIAFAALVSWKTIRFSRLAWIAGGIWTALVLFSLIDLNLGRRLYFSVVAYDYTFRSALVGALTRATVLPAANPFFFPGHAEPFRYHYFWFLLCSLPGRFMQAISLPHLFTPRHAVVAGTVWAGFSLFSALTMYLTVFVPPYGKVNITRAKSHWILVGLILFLVSGLDIIPVSLMDLSNLASHKHRFLPTVDWWNVDQVTGWLDTMLWVPHSIAALIACLTGFLVLFDEERARWGTVVAGALSFASAAGLSIYVTLVFAIFLVTWVVYLAVRRDYLQTGAFLLAGLLSVILSLPFLFELAGPSSAAGHFVVWSTPFRLGTVNAWTPPDSQPKCSIARRFVAPSRQLLS